MAWLETLLGAQEKSLLTNVAEIGVVVALSFAAYGSSKLKTFWKDKRYRKLHKGLDQNAIAREHMIELRGYYQADRVGIMQFHNGDYYISHESMMKMTLTHLVMGQGVAYPISSQSQLQNIPTTHFLHVLQELKSKGFAFYNSKAPVQDAYLKHIFTFSGSKSSLYAPMRDARGNWMGIILVTWLADHKKPDEEQLLKYADRIGSHLSTKF
jgi:hypothetical protein